MQVSYFLIWTRFLNMHFENTIGTLHGLEYLFSLKLTDYMLSYNLQHQKVNNVLVQSFSKFF